MSLEPGALLVSVADSTDGALAPGAVLDDEAPAPESVPNADELGALASVITLDELGAMGAESGPAFAMAPAFVMILDELGAIAVEAGPVFAVSFIRAQPRYR